MKRAAYATAVRYLFAIAVGVTPLPGLGQTCAAPIEVVNTNITGNTCDGTFNLPALANGAITNLGKDLVYHLATNNPYAGRIILQPEPTIDLSLFVCRGPCGTYSTCIGVADGGAGAQSSVDVPAGNTDYFIIVGATSGQCGSYALDIIYTLND
jgi:hypothetical protein